jgi:hypothetical protein
MTIRNCEVAFFGLGPYSAMAAWVMRIILRYDAIERSKGMSRHLQIKGRCLLPGCKPGQRLGRINVTKNFDAVLLVFLDDKLNALDIHEAERAAVLAALAAPGSKSRNDRGALGVSKFKSIGKLRWRRQGA